MEFLYQVGKDSDSCSLYTVPQTQDYMDGDSEINLEFHLLIL